MNENYWVKAAYNQLVEDYLQLLATKPDNVVNARSLAKERGWILHKLKGWAIKYVELTELKIEPA